jgi:hypothetical protein
VRCTGATVGTHSVYGDGVHYRLATLDAACVSSFRLAGYRKEAKTP